jgi:DNA polymerase (family 10)
MDNTEIANVLFELASLRELDGANPFSVRAIRQAAKVVASFQGDVLKTTLTDLQGVGEKIAAKVVEIAKSGTCEEVEKLRKNYPDVSDLTKVAGIGFKKAIKLHEEHDVTTRKELKRLLKRGVIDNPKLLQAVEFSEKAYERLPRFLAEQHVAPILAELRKTCQAVQVAGSLRRKAPDVKDVDILVTTDRPKATLKAFRAFGKLVVGEGDDSQKCSVFYESGNVKLRIDLLLIEPKSWGAALLYFTGSRDFGIALRKLAITKGYKLSEHGLFKWMD